MKMLDVKHRAVEKYLRRCVSDVISSYKAFREETEEAEKNIFVMWWQGIDGKTPKIVLSCIASIKRNNPGFSVIILTKDNIKSYIDIPERILNLFESGRVSFAQLSDIVRVSVLARHGGVWMDSTVFFSGEKHPDLWAKDYIILREGAKDSFYVTKGRWIGFFMGTKKRNTKLFSFLRDCFFSYWETHEYLCDYFLIDYLIDIAYQEFASDIIDGCAIDTPDIFLIMDRMDEKWDAVKEDFKKSWVYKLDFRKSSSAPDSLYFSLLSL